MDRGDVTTFGDDLISGGLDSGQGASGQKQPGSVCSERTGYGGTDRTAGAIDDRGLVLQQHDDLSFNQVQLERLNERSVILTAWPAFPFTSAAKRIDMSAPS
jgi:hypothetical protein